MNTNPTFDQVVDEVTEMVQAHKEVAELEKKLRMAKARLHDAKSEFIKDNRTHWPTLGGLRKFYRDGCSISLIMSQGGSISVELDILEQI